MKHTRTKLFALLLPLLLTACWDEGGGGPISSASAATDSQPSADQFHGLAVPPAPGLVADTTVAGVDTDTNGIRDEVDRALAKAYGGDAKKYAAAQYSARIDQRLLLTDDTDPVAAKQAMFASADSGGCLARLFKSEPLVGLELMHYVSALSLNTPERRAKKAAISAATGSFSRSVADAVCP